MPSHHSHLTTHSFCSKFSSFCRQFLKIEITLHSIIIIVLRSTLRSVRQSMTVRHMLFLGGLPGMPGLPTCLLLAWYVHWTFIALQLYNYNYKQKRYNTKQSKYIYHI